MIKKEFCIDRPQSGGLITNYYCTSRCGHCLYGCSPQWEKAYIDVETTGKNLEKIKELGCGSLEPFRLVPSLRSCAASMWRTCIDWPASRARMRGLAAPSRPRRW